MMTAEQAARRRGSLVNRLRWPIVAFVVIAVLITGLVLITVSGQAQRQEILRAQRRTAEEVALSISAYLQSARESLSLFVQLQNLPALERSRQQAAIERLLAQRQDIYEDLTLLDWNGFEIARVSRFHTFLPEELIYDHSLTLAFQTAMAGQNYLADEVTMSPQSGLPIIELAVPVRDAGSGEVVGVLLAQVSIKQMWDVVAEIEVGRSGYIYVVNATGRLLAHTDLGRYLRLQRQDIRRVPAVQRVTSGLAAPEAGEYTGLNEGWVVGASAPIKGTPWFTIVELPLTEAYANLGQMLLSLAGLLLAAVVVIGALTSWLPRRVVRPLAQLQQGAMLLSSGRLEHRIDLRTGDELEALGQAFNEMAVRLQELYVGLEQRVLERTRDLERRSRQLEAAAQVAREAAAIRDVAGLLNATVRLISEQFGFYHAGIFLLDEPGEYAVLRAASSEGGQRMLARGHRLRVGQVGIVGYVAGVGQPRIALDVGADAVFFDNPDLPQTRSEMALPLKVRGRVIGVLDVQSTQEAAFSAEDVEVLQTMADQVALAIENARLVEESQRAVQELETFYGRRLRQAWAERVAVRPTAYRYTGADVEAVTGTAALSAGPDEGHRLAAPINLRGQTIGSVVLRRAPDAEPWSDEEALLLEEVGLQIGLALENARLLEETRQRAEQERLISEITEHMRRTVDVETILQTTVTELGQALGVPRTYVRLGIDLGPEAGLRPEDADDTG